MGASVDTLNSFVALPVPKIPKYNFFSLFNLPYGIPKRDRQTILVTLEPVELQRSSRCLRKRINALIKKMASVSPKKIKKKFKNMFKHSMFEHFYFFFFNYLT